MHGSLFRNNYGGLVYMAVVQYSYMQSELKDFFKWKSSAAVFMY